MKTREDVYDFLNKNKIHTQIPREFDIEKDFYDKGIVRGEDLQDGKYYLGKCRNAHIAKWNEKKGVMQHQRDNWGNYFVEDINYINNDDNFDLFMAVGLIDEKDIPEHLLVP